MRVEYTHWPGKVDDSGRLLVPAFKFPYGVRRSAEWSKLCERLAAPRIEPVKENGQGFSIATFKDGHRLKANVEHVYAVGLDFDHDVDLGLLRRLFAESLAFVHTTHSSTLAAPRARVFLPTSRPCSTAEYERVWLAVAGKVEASGLVLDQAPKDPSRFWYLPASASHGTPVLHWTSDGLPVDVDAALAAVPASVPPPPPTPRPLSTGGASAFDRARKYIANVPGAIEGSGGSAATLVAAMYMVRGFALSVDDAMVLLSEWNQTCKPVWRDADLRRKAEQALSTGRMPMGELLDRERPR